MPAAEDESEARARARGPGWRGVADVGEAFEFMERKVEAYASG